MTDKDQLKYRNWVFTWLSDDEEKLVDSNVLQRFLEKHVEVYAFQLERGEESNKLHYQGCFRTKIRQRKQTVLLKFSQLSNVKQLTVRNMKGTWTEAFNYSTKEDTRVGTNYVSSSSLQIYTGKDIELLEDPENYFPWQNQIMDEIFKTGTFNPKVAHDRKIYWLSDSKGNTGKSKFTKFLCVNSAACIKLPFGSAQQIRSSVIAAGPQQLYIIDIPRTIGEDDSIDSLISAIEDIKNGFVVSAFYGKYTTQIWDPPHVVVFSNDRCKRELMSLDRWAEYVIDPIDKTLIPGERVTCAI